MLCFHRSLSSFTRITINNKKKIEGLFDKNINPRQIHISSQKYYTFNCDNCPHIFKSKLGNTTLLNRWCPYCCISNSKLCNDLDCQYCLNKSFASFTGLTISNNKILDLWSSKNKIKPRDILKKSNKMCMFNCDKCGITFKSNLSYITNNGSWCPKCSNSGTSKPAREWIKYISHNKNMQHFDSDEGEYKIPNTNYKADGYDKDTNTIYEFHGDFWHGNPKKYNPEDINPISDKTFGELYKKTEDKKKSVKKIGYNYVCIWESEWINFKNTIIKIQKSWRFKYSKK